RAQRSRGSAGRRTGRPAAGGRAAGRTGRRWVRGVKTVSTYPPRGLFKRDARTIARTLASKRVSPKGVGWGLRMLLFYITRGGRGLSPSRRAELERAKRLLRRRMRETRGVRRRRR